MGELIENCIDEVIETEGGEESYVNDPSDSGKETNWGVTVAVARRYGYKGEMKLMPRSAAVGIYAQRYWHKLNLDLIQRISQTITKEMFDTGVNCGTAFAAKSFQRSLNVLNLKGRLYPDLKVDGKIGGKSLNALEDYLSFRENQGGESVLYNMLNSLQGAHYIQLAEQREKDEKYTFGWFKHRVSLALSAKQIK